MDEINNITVPYHVAIIPDGNRRWAKQRGMMAIAGHKAGANRFKETVKLSYKKGIKVITFYAFSTENWKRTKEEVEQLMKLLGSFLLNFEAELGDDRDKIKICVIGDRSKLSRTLNEQILTVENATKDNTGILVNIALNYGSRDELLNAFRIISEKVKSGEIASEDIDEELVSKTMYDGISPDPDLLIRTSGEQRISNFMLWQIAYSELYFCDCLWPDFDEKELDSAILAYSNRKRRFGK